LGFGDVCTQIQIANARLNDDHVLDFGTYVPRSRSHMPLNNDRDLDFGDLRTQIPIANALLNDDRVLDFGAVSA